MAWSRTCVGFNEVGVLASGDDNAAATRTIKTRQGIKLIWQCAVRGGEALERLKALLEG